MSIYHSQQTISRPSYLGGANWELRGLADITVLVGKNGSGKSMLLRAWRDQAPDEVHYVAPERTGDIAFQPHYIQEEFDGASRKASSLSNFVPEYRRRLLARVHRYFMIRGNCRDPAPVPGNPTKLETLLESLLPEFSIKLTVNSPPYEIMRVDTNDVIKQINEVSSGEAQMLTLALDVLTIAAIWELEGRTKKVVLLDEPDAHIHPDLQVRFAEFLMRVIRQFDLQAIVATHSTALLSAIGQFGANSASVIYMNKNICEYKSVKFNDVNRQVASCLGGNVLMGPLFGAPLLLVEGDDDYRIWSQVPRHHLIQLAVIPCNGEEIRRYQRTLETILASICEAQPAPRGFALVDGDKSLPVANPTATQDFIKFIKLNCRESENLFLTDTVLASLSLTWQNARRSIRDKARMYDQKCEALLAITDGDRQWHDIKPVINQLSEILDPKAVLWTVRVGTALGRARPTGELADFIGAGVIEALWG